MGIPTVDEWASKHIKKLAAEHPELGITASDSDAQALLKVCRKAAEQAKNLPGKAKNPDAFIEQVVDMAEAGVRNLWFIPASYYVAFRQALGAVAKQGDTAGIVEAIQSVLDTQEPAKPAPQKKK